MGHVTHVIQDGLQERECVNRVYSECIASVLYSVIQQVNSGYVCRITDLTDVHSYMQLLSSVQYSIALQSIRSYHES